MRSTKTTIRFKLSRAEDARALEYLRDRKVTGSSFSKSVVQAIMPVWMPKKWKTERILSWADSGLCFGKS